MRIPITDIPLEKLKEVTAKLGLKSFATDQIIRWLYARRVSSFDEMTNLLKSARDALSKKFLIDAVKKERVLEARDGTKKFLCTAIDGAAIECVLIPAEDGRNTVCISTQAGCAMGCTFCRTGETGFARNLTQGEILGQLIITMKESETPITNVVLMGMGEPLANLENVANAVRVMTDSRAFNLSKRRVTISTSGLVAELEEFLKHFDIKVAISLNATTDDVRQKIMPVNRRYPIAEIMKFAKAYAKRSRHRVTFEYVMMRGINDTDDDIKRLIGLMKGVRAKINLIPYNPYEGSPYKAPYDATVERWAEKLREGAIQVNVRQSRGQEIMAACGQLAGSGSSRK